MESELILKKLKEKFGPGVIETETRSYKRCTATIDPANITEVAEYLYKDEGFRFIIASGLHTRRGFEIHYHFSFDSTGLILNIHVILNPEKPSIESLSNLFNASNWIEREIHEILGIDFINHPDPEKLISEGNWAEGVYPYRKEFK
ncbi:MAG TPA: NADH-quinone oxidoreductase subunit C [Bacteroidales bacterium]|nr:NADH-quinone oxidoreductase subunit C [Bacteroidales bacterium]